MREAISQAKEAFNLLGQTARSLTLYGTVLAKEPLTLEKAKTFLERALRVDPLYTAAVYPLADIHASLQEFDKGAELLRKQLVLQSTGKLHQILGDFLSQLKEYQEAMDQYSISLSLDPSNSRALDGIQRVEKASDLVGHSGAGASGLRSGGAFDDMDGLDSENEADLSDGPDAGGGEWSDNDFN
jgi:anaphase-promoting complex subunit 7